MESLNEQNNEETNVEQTNDSSSTTIMLTTVDNPFDPFTNFEEWKAFDEAKGYNTCAYLARIAKVSDELSDADEILAIHLAIDEIVRMNILGIYKKVRHRGEGPA